MDLGKSINISMAIDGLNQQSLSDKTGIAQTSISQMIARGTCHTGTLDRLAEAFGIRTSEFVARGEK